MSKQPTNIPNIRNAVEEGAAEFEDALDEKKPMGSAWALAVGFVHNHWARRYYLRRGGKSLAGS